MKIIPINEKYLCVCSGIDLSDVLFEQMLWIAEDSTECIISLDYFQKKGQNKRHVHQFINKYSIIERYVFAPYVMVRKDCFCEKANDIQTVIAKALARGANVKHVHQPFGVVDIERQEVLSCEYLRHTQDFHNSKYKLCFVDRLRRDLVLKKPDSFQQKVLVIILSSNSKLLYDCLYRLLNFSVRLNIDIHVGWYSQSGTDEEPSNVARMAKMFQTKLHWFDGSERFNYSALNNQIFEEAYEDHDYVLLLNDDVKILDNHFLPSMLAVAEAQSAKVVGAELYYPKERGKPTLYQHGGIKLGNNFTHFEHVYHQKPVDKHYLPTREVSAVTFAAALIESQHYADLQLDEMYYGDCNDVDFCLRTREANGSIWYCNMAKAIHCESFTRKKDHTMQNDKNSPKFYRRNLRRLKKEFRFI